MVLLSKLDSLHEKKEGFWNATAAIILPVLKGQKEHKAEGTSKGERGNEDFSALSWVKRHICCTFRG